MPCIRRRYHYGCIYIDDENVEIIGRALVGNRLDAMTHCGQTKLVNFGGFLIEPDNITQPIKLRNIEAYSHKGYFSDEWARAWA